MSFFPGLSQPRTASKIVFVWMIGIFTWSVWWFFDYASNSTRPGMEVAAIIAAVNTPLSFLVGHLLTVWQRLVEMMERQENEKRAMEERERLLAATPPPPQPPTTTTYTLPGM